MFAFVFSFSRSFATTALTITVLAIGGCGDDHAGHDHAAGEHDAVAAHPLDTCVVSGKKLGSMGDPVLVNHDGVEVRLCCSGCVKTFNNDPEKYVAMVETAAAEPAEKK